MNTHPLSPTHLLRTVLTRLVCAVLLVGALLFLPAGTLRYWEAWVYLAVLFVPMSAMAAYLLLYDPELMERRLRLREKEHQQRRVVAISAVILLAIILVPAFDRRYDWSAVTIGLVLAADGGILLGYSLFALTLKENRYAARTIAVEQQQQLIATGPYRLVRHPMYLAMILMFGLTPLALDSYWALLPAALFPAALIARILNEECVLHRELDAYADYCHTVRYRLLSFIW